MKNVSDNLKEVYDNEYSAEDTKWRDLGGKQKALNLIEITKGLDFEKVVDVGSGDGAVLEWLEKQNFKHDINSLEISESGKKVIETRNLKSVKEVKIFDGYNIPFSDKQFNLALCSHVIEHVEHPRILLREIARVSDYQVFEVPIDFSLNVDSKIKHYLAYGHINIYTPALFKFLLKSEGFEVIKEKFVFYDDEIIKMATKSPIKYYKLKFKNFIVKSIPILKKTKPNAYTVLCKHNGESLKIF